MHAQAFLNFAVQAKKKVGKNKEKPVYTVFSKFFNYEKAENDVLNKGNKGKKRSIFEGIGKLPKKGENNNG